MWIRIGAAAAARANNATGFSHSIAGSTQARRPAPPDLSREEEIAERALRRRIRDDQRIVKSLRPGAAVPPFEKCGDRILVFAACQAGVDRQGAAALEIRELEIAPVRQVDLVAA